ncbi:bestrophin family protein [Chitinophaga solisilvae]|uniref:Multidrug transporter n=1 Tax=Chitinophaga solisilvae TaxID=1233460 RepID=A0A3S1B0P2_9BACT|nr:bestrophin family ion channel [Chitinophaga solisilvae]NSL87673.1 multidrug transporter [Chitinophaga solisilvae]
MHIGNHYKIREFLVWTRGNIYWLVLIACIPTTLYYFFDCKWVAVPWVPVALIGTAAAFIAGFRNTQTYNRMWEARQIWGSIVNSSRTWGIMVKDFIRHPDKATEQRLHRELVYRHIGWLTALRFQLRESRPWETIKSNRYNREYQSNYKVQEWENNLPDELKPFIPATELPELLEKKNRATQIIALQSAHLRQLNEQQHLSDLSYVEMENVLKELYEHQGKSERIKNFPYPRQYASINLFFIRLLVILLPFGMINEFAKMGDMGIWLTIPFSALTGWVFLALEQVGEATENPFEGSANDIPITSMSRTIEIDLREILGEKELPLPIPAINNILM